MSFQYPAAPDSFPSGRWRWSPDPYKPSGGSPYPPYPCYPSMPPPPPPGYASPYPPPYPQTRRSRRSSGAHSSPYYPPPGPPFDAQPYSSDYPIPSTVPTPMPGPAPSPSSTFPMAGQTPLMTVNFSSPPPPYNPYRPITPPSSDGSPYDSRRHRDSDGTHHRRSSYSHRHSRDIEHQRRPSDQEKKVHFRDRGRTPSPYVIQDIQVERSPPSRRARAPSPDVYIVPPRVSPPRRTDSWTPISPTGQSRNPWSSNGYIPRSGSFQEADERPSTFIRPVSVSPDGPRQPPIGFVAAAEPRRRPITAISPTSPERVSAHRSRVPVIAQRDRIERALRDGDTKVTALVELVGLPKLLDLLTLITDDESGARSYNANDNNARQVSGDGRSVHEADINWNPQDDVIVESRIRPFRETSDGIYVPEIPPVPLEYSVELVPAETIRVMENEPSGRSRSETLEPRED